MKANEAPEKIFLHPDIGGREFIRPWLKRRANQDSVEYTRTDAFIEKACEFLRNNIDKQLTIYHDNTWRKRDEFIEAFRQFMKEEKV